MLRRQTFADVQHDSFATFQAVQIGMMAAISSALGIAAVGEKQPLAAALLVVIRWMAIAYGIDYLRRQSSPRRRVLGGNREAMRVTGFAQTPLLLTFLGPIPVFGAVLWFVAQLWWAAGMYIAVRQLLGPGATRIAGWGVALATIPGVVIWFTG